MTTGFIFRAAFFLLFFAILFLSQRFWFRSLWRVSDSWKSAALRRAVRGVAVGLLVFLIVSLLDRMVLRALPRGGAYSYLLTVTQLWMLPSMLAYLIFKVVTGFGWAVFRIRGLFSRTPSTELADAGRRVFVRRAAQIAAAMPLAAAAYGFVSERFAFRVRRADVPIAGLPPGLDGFQIVQLSDIHIGDFMPRDEVKRAVDVANSLSAHVAVITGDLVTGENDPLEACVAELKRLRTPLGVFGCNGNHEIYADAEDAAEQLFLQNGMRMLRHDRAELEWRGGKLNLMGVDYQRDGMVRGPRRPMLEGVEPLVRIDMPNILLSHNPNSFYKAAELGIELTLAGHTHGGQVQVEILDKQFSPARFITQFIAGRYELPLGNSQGDLARQAFLYVNRGLGTIGVPARFDVDPEITLLTLRRA